METTRISTNDLKFTIETLKEAARTLDYLSEGAGEACRKLAETLYVENLCKIFVTTAPVEYDYSYTVELLTGCLPPPGFEGIEKNEWRKVAILKSHADYQTARYSSGLYVTREVPK